MNKNIKNSLVKIIFIVSVLILWQVLYTLKIWPEILFPSLGDIGKAFVTAFTERELGTMVLHLSLIHILSTAFQQKSTLNQKGQPLTENQ